MEYVTVFGMTCAGFLAIFALLGLLFYSNEKAYKAKMLEKKELMWGPIAEARRDLAGFKETLTEYRKQHVANIEAYNQVHEHLQKVTDQMQSLRKSQRILKDNMVMRFGLVVTDKNKETFRRIAKQLEQL